MFHRQTVPPAMAATLASSGGSPSGQPTRLARAQSTLATASAVAPAAAGRPSAAHPSQNEDWVYALRAERDFIADELLVKNQLAISLGSVIVKLKAELHAARAEVEARNEQLNNFTSEMAAMRQASVEAASRTTAAEKKARALEQQVQSSSDAVARLGASFQTVEQLQAEVVSVRKERDQLSETMADWKLKMKDALKEARRKEQQMMSDEFALRTEVKSLQEKLDRAEFQLQSAAVRDARPRASTETQTDPVSFAEDVVRLGSISAGRRSHTRVPSLQGVAVTSPEGHDYTAAADSPRPPPLPMAQARAAVGSSVSAARAGSEGRRFPLPLLLTPTPKAAAATDDPTSPDPPPPPPIIVSIHFGTSEGWTLDTKHAVTAGMTVEELITTCCDMIKSRYGQQVDPSLMCLKIHHEHAKRSVVLSGHRELHSFSYVQKLQRSGTMVKLFLENKDELHEQIRDFMNPG